MSDKILVARNSALASLAMTILKFAAGFATGSLSLISEASHSTVDFLAAVVTYLSVRTSGRPADKEHHYGHGKLENLSAFAEAIILFGTAVFIIAGAISRLLHRHQAQSESAVWYVAIAVVALAIIVDFSRSVALRRAARQHHSQALEADALHFTVELLSSAVVLAGLLLVKFGGEELWWADPVAALGVAAVMLYVAFTLAKRSADVLVDRAPEGLEARLQQTIRQVPGVCDVPRVRARQSGAATFVDATITVDPLEGVGAGHRIASAVEHVVTEAFPATDVFIHVEPAATGHADEVAAIRELAAGLNLAVHAIRVRDIDGMLYVNFHIELPPETTLAQAHEQVSPLEDRIRLRLPRVAEVDSHVEPTGLGTPH